MNYTIKKVPRLPTLTCDPAAWNDANILHIAHFHPDSTAHRPITTARLLYDETGLACLFEVQDRYVRCVNTEYQSPVSKDSCVEFFAQPKPALGYFNFEFNCGGAMLLSYVDTTREKGDPTRATRIPWQIAQRIQIARTLPRTVEPEIAEPTTWRLAFSVPFDLFEPYIGPIRPPAGTTWRANFYKCGGNTSHPHWASWSPIGQKLTFHDPQYFAPITFEH